MNFEVVIGDIEYEWSLGVYETEKEALDKIRLSKSALKKTRMHAPDDHTFTVMSTSDAPRGAIWPSNPAYDAWLKRNKRSLNKVAA